MKKDTETINIRRLEVIVGLIKKDFYRVEDLAKLTARHPRTIKRDLKLLRKEFDAPIIFDRKHGGFVFEKLDWNLLDQNQTAKKLENGTETYSLPEIADKLATGAELNEIERQMAAGAILDWVRLKESRITGGKTKGTGRKVTLNTPAAIANRERVRKFRSKLNESNSK